MSFDLNIREHKENKQNLSVSNCFLKNSSDKADARIEICSPGAS